MCVEWRHKIKLKQLKNIIDFVNRISGRGFHVNMYLKIIKNKKKTKLLKYNIYKNMVFFFIYLFLYIVMNKAM